MPTLLTTFLFSIGFVFCYGQSFTNVAVQQNIWHQYHSGEYSGGVSFVDFNQDGWDDITLAQNDGAPAFFMNDHGNFTLLSELAATANLTELKAVQWVDYDNDGDLDFFCTANNAPFRLYRNTNNIFVEATASAGFVPTYHMTYGACWADYDRDGDLDVYLCNYDAPGYGDANTTNTFYRNNGNGTFSDYTTTAGIGNGSNYTFQAIWTDYDHDLWPDLFVINDRYESSNYLYHNNGDGTFTDVSVAAGVSDYILAMNASGEDYDNDGDLDLYVCNTNEGNRCKQNNGDGTFTEVAEINGTSLDRFTWGANFIDADNDGWQDLFVASTPHIFTPGQNQFLKNDSGTFVNMTLAAGLDEFSGWSRSNAIGDLDNDGYADIAVLKNDPDYSILLQNNEIDNNWLKVNLAGTESNRFGVGSWISCYAGELVNTRFTYLGESYLGQNSFTEFFGLGSNTIVDSLKVEWPSGIVDVWYNILPNQNLHLVEGNSQSVSINSANGAFLMCNYQPLTLTTGQWSSYNWSNGSSNSSTTINEPGQYVLMVSDSHGNFMLSDTVTIVNSTSQIHAEITPPTCFGMNDGSLTLSGIGQELLNALTWIDGNVGPTRHEITSGDYTYFVIDSLGCPLSDTVHISGPDPLEASFDITNVRCFGQSNGHAEMQIIGGTGPYQVLNPPQFFANLPEGDYSTEIIDSHGCSASANFHIAQPDPMLAEIAVTDALCFGSSNGTANALVSGGNGGYVANWQGHNPEALSAGNYLVSIIDSLGCAVIVPYQILQPDALSADVLTTPALCHGENSGTIDVNISGGVGGAFVNWGEQDPSYMAAGNYVFLYTDLNACIGFFEATITEPTAISIQVSATPASCFGQNDGTASAQALGGTGNLNIDWNGDDQNALYGGEHIVIASDENGCQVEHTYSIEQPDMIVAIITTTPATGATNTGTADIEISGGTPPYLIIGEDGQPGFWPINNLAAGTYSVEVTDANGCSVMQEFTVEMTIGIDPTDLPSLQLYPNPCASELTLSTPINGEVVIYDTIGKCVFSSRKNQTNYRIDTSKFAFGIYVIQLENWKETFIK
jgi:ASPIC and UnbV/FG-GAP-like repeat/Secretion system C-terminal sorting domain/SprB repeat